MDEKQKHKLGKRLLEQFKSARSRGEIGPESALSQLVDQNNARGATEIFLEWRAQKVVKNSWDGSFLSYGLRPQDARESIENWAGILRRMQVLD